MNVLCTLRNIQPEQHIVNTSFGKRKKKMAESRKGMYTLRMRQLPKPEYSLSKQFIQTYNLTDLSELFAIALRLMAEVERYGDNSQGKQWIIQVINSYRSLTEKERSVDNR